MHPLLQSSLVGGVFTTAIAVSVVLRGGKTRRENLFLFLVVSLSVYYTLSFLYLWKQNQILFRFFLASSLVIPNATLRFFRAFIGPRDRKSRLTIFSFISSIGVGLLCVPPFLPDRVAGGVVMVFVGIMLYISIYYLYTRSRKVRSKVESTRIIYLVVGGLIAITFSFTDFLMSIHITFLPIGSLLTSIYLYLLSQAIFSYRLMDLYELFGKMAVLGALALALAGIFSVLTLFEMASTSFFVNAMAAAFVILIIFDPLRDMVEKRIGEFFLKERKDFVDSIEETRREIARAFEIDGIASTLMEGLKKSGRFTNACFYTIDEVREKFLLRGYEGQKSPDVISVPTIRPLLEMLKSEGYVVADSLSSRMRRAKTLENKEEIEGEEKNYKNGKSSEIAECETVLATMDELKAKVIIPVAEKDIIYGIIGVSDERFRDPFSDEDLNLLKSLGSHVAVAIENTRLYERIKEKDRLAAIGEMSAGLAHEIRNPLGAIKGAIQLITEDAPHPDSAVKDASRDREFLDIIISEVDRLNRVVSSFLDYARPTSTRDEKTLCDVNAVIKQAGKVVEGEIANTGVKVEFDLEKDISKVKISEEKLGQVVWNLLMNGIEAAGAAGREGRVVVSSKTAKKDTPWRSFPYDDKDGIFVEISVSDNGRGIPSTILPKIFIPFFTTKVKGTGLGLAISHRIIREAGGMIEVDTKEGKGTTFKILLPALP